MTSRGWTCTGDANYGGTCGLHDHRYAWCYTTVMHNWDYCSNGEVVHEKLAQGQAYCPAGTQVTSAAECKAALKSLGLEVELREGISTQMPLGCSVNEKSAGGHFNSAASSAAGAGQADTAPICRAASV